MHRYLTSSPCVTLPLHKKNAFYKYLAACVYIGSNRSDSPNVGIQGPNRIYTILSLTTGHYANRAMQKGRKACIIILVWFESISEKISREVANHFGKTMHTTTHLKSCLRTEPLPLDQGTRARSILESIRPNESMVNNIY